MAGNLFGGFGGLHRKHFDFGSNDSEAASRFASPCRLNGRVQGKKVCLPGDGADQLNDISDLLCCLSEPGTFVVRCLSLGNGVAHDRLGLVQLLIDFRDRGQQFFGGGGNLRNIGRGLVRFPQRRFGMLRGLLR